MSRRSGIRAALRGLALLAGLLGLPAEASAQTAFGVKSYGELRSQAPPRTLALGGVGAVLPWGDRSSALGLPNPAAAAFSEQALFGFTWELGRLGGEYTDGNAVQWDTGPRMMGLLLAFGKGWAGTVRLQPVSISDFEIHSPDTEVNGVPVHYDYLGTGGLNTGRFSLAWRTPDGRLAVGAATDIYFGALKQRWDVEFLDTGYTDTSDSLQRQHRGLGWSVGVQGEPMGRLRLGALIEGGVRLKMKQLYTSTGAGSDTSSGSFRSGPVFQVSSGFRLNEQWALYADFRRAGWDRAEWITQPAAPGGIGLGGMDLTALGAEQDYGFGVERLARSIEDQRVALDAMPLRAGFRTGTLYARDLDGGSVNQWYLTLGTSLSLGGSDGGWLDLSFQYGGRSGTTGAREKFWRLQLGITASERWFQAPQR